MTALPESARPAWPGPPRAGSGSRSRRRARLLWWRSNSSMRLRAEASSPRWRATRRRGPSTMPRFAGGVSAATSSTAATASSQRPSENRPRARYSADMLRWARLDTRSAAAVASRPAATASSKRPSAASVTAMLPSEAETSDGAWRSRIARAAWNRGERLDRPRHLDQRGGPAVEGGAELLVGSGFLGRGGRLGSDRLRLLSRAVTVEQHASVAAASAKAASCSSRSDAYSSRSGPISSAGGRLQRYTHSSRARSRRASRVCPACSCSSRAEA